MRLGIMVLFALWGIGSAQPCEDYVAIDSEQTKELMATLGDPDKSSVDRLFAFQTLKCSDMPVLRDYAMREGLKNSKDNTVRAQIMMDALMAKPVLKIALIATPAVGPKGRDFIKRNEGAIYLGNQFSDPRRAASVLRPLNACRATACISRGRRLLSSVGASSASSNSATRTR